MNDEVFFVLVCVVIGVVIYLLEWVCDMVECFSEWEEDFMVWVCVVVVVGCLLVIDVVFVVYQLYGVVKVFVFWLQIMMGQLLLMVQEQQKVVELVVDMFFVYYV